MQIARTRCAGQAGFTLVELLVVAIVIGVLGMTIASIFPLFASMGHQEYVARQKRINAEIARAMESWAVSHSTATDRLPAPYTGGDIKQGVLNPSSTDDAVVALADYIGRRGVDPAALVDDASPSRNARVYQRVTGLSEDTPLYGVSGPRIRLSYHAGVIYTTDCSSPCAAALPGSSPALTAANRNTWSVSGADVGAAVVSSLSVERARAAVTAERMRRISSAMTAYFNIRKVASSPTDMTNHFPALSAPVASGSSGTLGCRGAWSNLTATQLNVLGLPTDEFSVTAWGAPIQYCRDYAPDASPADTVPHYAAIRIHADVTSGSVPSNVACTAGNFPACSVVHAF